MDKTVWRDPPKDADIHSPLSVPCNYYGGPGVWRDGDLHFFGIENYDGWHGREVSEEFFNAFMREFPA